MNRLKACALVLLLWAAIYLPGLGSTEIKGEEGRRILPAITMLETGNWLVPYVGGKPFLRKPPLVNWAIAASFKLTGVRNEWTARIPSALCVLALALTIVGTSGAGWISVETALVAAVMAMTQFGLLAKARFAGAEIEGIYAPLSGIAVVCWLAWWSRGRSPWLVWLAPGAVLGLASLAKGPSFHLIFFYAITLTVLGSAKTLARSFPSGAFHRARTQHRDLRRVGGAVLPYSGGERLPRQCGSDRGSTASPTVNFTRAITFSTSRGRSGINCPGCSWRPSPSLASGEAVERRRNSSLQTVATLSAASCGRAPAASSPCS